MEISRGFTNDYGKSYDNIVNINFDSFNEMTDSLGTFIIETDKKDKCAFTDKNESLGILLHRMKNTEDSDYAFRIYKNYEKAQFHRHYDEVLVSKLQSKQSNIKKSDFPIGVLSINYYVIGQIVIYYDKCETIFNYLKYCKDINVFKLCCFQIVSIVEELLDNGIFFTDIHSKNFLINSDMQIKIIDFENPFIKFNDNSLYKDILNKLIYMFKYASKFINFTVSYDSSLNEIKEKILELN